MFLADEARINRLQLNNEAALENLTEASRLDPENTWVWINLGDLWLERGSLVEAGSAYAAASKAAVASGDDRDRMITQSKLADVSIRQGDRPTALTAYRLVLEINEAIFRRDPGNAEWQRDLSVSHNRIGDVLRARGRPATGALNSYRAGLAIAETLARRDPGNTEWQRDLSISHEQDRRRAGGAGRPATGALNAYRAGLAIPETLARRDPGNTEWQRDLSVSHERIGDVLVAAGRPRGRARLLPRRPRDPRAPRPPRPRQHRMAARPLGQPQQDRRRAAGAGRPRRARSTPTAPASRSPRRWPAATPATPNGSATSRSATTGSATCWWRRATARARSKPTAPASRSARRLARRDPGNAEWQRDLIVSCVKIAGADPQAAPALLTRALDIAKQLEASGKFAPVDAWMPGELTRMLAELTAK